VAEASLDFDVQSITHQLISALSQRLPRPGHYLDLAEARAAQIAGAIAVNGPDGLHAFLETGPTSGSAATHATDDSGLLETRLVSAPSVGIRFGSLRSSTTADRGSIPYPILPQGRMRL